MKEEAVRDRGTPKKHTSEGRNLFSRGKNHERGEKNDMTKER